jgi:hypothetical protein
MVKITDDNRQAIVESYIDQIIDSTDLKDLIMMVADFIENNLRDYTNEQLENEIVDYYPHLLDFEEEVE